MKKLEVTLNESPTDLYHHLGLVYAEGEPDVNQKITDTFTKIYSDEIETQGDIVEHIVKTFSQEELVAITATSLKKMFKKYHKRRLMALGADSPSPEPNMMNVIKALGMFATIMTKSNNFFASNREEMIDKLVAFFGARDVTIDKEPLLNAKSKDEFMDALQKQINSSGFMAANMNFPDAHFSTETSTEKSSEESPVAEQSDKE